MASNVTASVGQIQTILDFEITTNERNEIGLDQVVDHDLSDPISPEVQEAVSFWTYSIISPAVGTLGVCTNIINIIIFVKIGFKDSMNISFLGLSVSDLLSLTFMLWTSICRLPFLQSTFPDIDWLAINYVTASTPRVIFNKITTLTTAFMTFERCLCIAIPLKVKAIITRFRTKIVIISIYISGLLAFSPFYYVNRLKWYWIPPRNTSILSLSFTSDRALVEMVTYYIQGLALTFTPMLFVITCTIVLIVKLHNKAKWRQESMDKSQAESVSSKEKQVIKMVVVLSSIFIICSTPETLIFLAMAVEHELSLGGKYTYSFSVFWAIALMLYTINSSVNIFVYFKMSSKYKNMFLKTFLKRSEEKI